MMAKPQFLLVGVAGVTRLLSYFQWIWQVKAIPGCLAEIMAPRAPERALLCR
jgi:hypothetical protein